MKMFNPRYALFIRHVDIGYWRFTGSYKYLSQSIREGIQYSREGDRMFVLDMETQTIVANENGLDMEAFMKIKKTKQ